MIPGPQARLNFWIDASPRVAGATAIVAGSIVLIGWMLDVPVLKSLNPDLVSMKANTALAFVLAGISLMVYAAPATAGQNMIPRFLASVVGLIGLLTVLEYAFTWDAGIDQLLFNEPQGTFGTYSPGRMALNTAVSLCLLGASLIMIKGKTRWGEALAHIAALVIGFFGLLVLLAYADGLSAFTGYAVYTQMALPTAATFMILTVGLLCLQPDVGVVGVIAREGPGGYMVGRLMLAAVAVPPVLGWIVARGEMVGLYGNRFGEVIGATATIAIFMSLVWMIGRSLNKLDVERTRSEKEILGSEKQFKELFNDAPVAYHELDLDGRIVRVNETELRSLGYRLEEMLGHFVWEFLDDQEASRQSVLAKLGGTKPLAKSVERVYRRKNLTTITVVSQDVLLQDADGRIAGIRTTLQDITEVKRAQDLLHRSEERFRQVAESAGEWIWETDPHGLYTFSSSAVQTILGYQPEEIIGKKYFYDFFTPDVRDELKHAALNAFEHKERIRGMIHPNLHKNGNVVVLETTGVPVLDENGKLMGYRGTDTDITSRMRAEDSLIAERSLLRTLIDHLPDTIYVKDAACRKILANPVDVRSMGASSEAEVLGKTDFDFYPPELAAAFRADDQSVIQSGQPVLNREEMTTLPDRTIGWQLTSKVPLRDSAGQVIGLMGIGHDVTKRKRAEQAVIASELELRRVWEASFDGMRVVDGQGTILMVNEAYCTLIGKSREELVGKPLSIITVELGQQQMLEKHKRRFSSGTIQPRTEKELELWDGRRLWFEVSNSYIEIEGQPKRALGIFRDVTERKRAEKLTEALYGISQAVHSTGNLDELYRHIHDALSSIIPASNFSIALLTDDGKALYFPYERDEKGAADSVTIDADNPESLTVEVLRSKLPLLLDEKELHDRFSSGRNKAGGAAPKCWLGVPLMDGEYAVGVMAVQDYRRGHVYSVKDVVLFESAASQVVLALERKRVAEAMRKSEDRYRNIFENVQDVYYEALMDGTILEISPSIEVLSNGQYRREDLIGRSMYDFYSEATERQTLLSALQVRGRVTDFEIMLKNRDGSQTPCSLMSTIRLDAQGRPERIIGSVRDITERKLAEQERESLINELKTALDNVKTLDGLVPICAHCKKIRDDTGYWNQLEQYIGEHTDAKLTHGLCPDCAVLYFPGIAANSSPGRNL